MKLRDLLRTLVFHQFWSLLLHLQVAKMNLIYFPHRIDLISWINIVSHYCVLLLHENNPIPCARNQIYYRKSDRIRHLTTNFLLISIEYHKHQSKRFFHPIFRPLLLIYLDYHDPLVPLIQDSNLKLEVAYTFTYQGRLLIISFCWSRRLKPLYPSP
jgi:hypothetical protein